MFRGKESSNRIELSWLVQDLLTFGVLGSLQLWGWGGGWMGVVGGCPPHMCTCAHGKHDNFMQMAAPIGGIPGISYDVIHVCMCVCACTGVCTCVGGTLSPPPTHIHPPTHPPGGDPRNQSKFNSTWTNQDISILFEDLKSVETSPPMDGCTIWWVGGLMGGVRSKHLKFKNCCMNQDNSILFEDLWFVETPPPMGDTMGGWVSGSMGGVNSND